MVGAEESESTAKELQLPGLLSDNMVLQQSTKICLWGASTPGSVVHLKASWLATPLQVESSKTGDWKLFIDTPAATLDPQMLTFWSGKDTLSLKEVLIGEVWFCSGQSNMEMPLRGFQNAPIEGANRAIATAELHPLVRYATIKRVGADVPKKFAEGGEWQQSTTQNAPEFGATAYFFAQQLASVLQIPVGIINCSWGGSRVEGWLPKEILEGYADVKFDKSEEYEFLYPMIMYNGMLKPSANYTAKGFLWYQGESNVGAPDYAERLATMVKHWRSLWGDDSMPFYQVEIAPYQNYGEGETGAYLREQQLKSTKLIPHSGLVSTNDLIEPFEKFEIHPKEKKTIGERLAFMALSDSYGYENIRSHGPVYERMEVEDTTAVLFFEHAAGGYYSKGEVVGFEIAGEDRQFHPAHVKLEWQRNALLVTSPQVAKPVAVRYCFRNFQLGNLTNVFGLPVYPFRTDSW
ncbi:MAG: sialate O-acetylesterase [Phocaeicola sp.]